MQKRLQKNLTRATEEYYVTLRKINRIAWREKIYIKEKHFYLLQEVTEEDRASYKIHHYQSYLSQFVYPAGIIQ